MRIFRYDSGGGQEIKEYNSSNVFISPILQIEKGAVIHLMSFDPQAVIGSHQTGGPQVLLVIEGEGWVRSESPEPIPVAEGDAVFWDSGEWHESGSEAGMTAIVIEATTPGLTTLSLQQ
jgi:quercetin dioxygenase-like cupin family protein